MGFCVLLVLSHLLMMIAPHAACRHGSQEQVNAPLLPSVISALHDERPVDRCSRAHA